MSQYAVQFVCPGQSDEGLAALRAAHEGPHPGVTGTSGAGNRLMVSFPAEDNYTARTKALRMQDHLRDAGVAVTSARIRGSMLSPWYDLNEEGTPE